MRVTGTMTVKMVIRRAVIMTMIETTVMKMTTTTAMAMTMFSCEMRREGGTHRCCCGR